MGFKSPAQIEQRPHDERWRLVCPLIYEGRDDVFVIAQDFVTDLATIPRPLQWLVPRSGRYISAALLHDALRVRLRQSRDDGREPPPFTVRDADGIFRAALREAGMSVLRRRVTYWGVRAAGTFEFRKGFRRIAAGAALGAAGLLGAGVLLPIGAYLGLLAAGEVAVYVGLQVAWRHDPRRLVGVPWPFARRARAANGRPFLSVHPKAEAAADKAVRMVVLADELPLQLPVPPRTLDGAAALPTIVPVEVPAEAVALCLVHGTHALRAAVAS